MRHPTAGSTPALHHARRATGRGATAAVGLEAVHALRHEPPPHLGHPVHPLEVQHDLLDGPVLLAGRHRVLQGAPADGGARRHIRVLIPVPGPGPLPALARAEVRERRDHGVRAAEADDALQVQAHGGALAADVAHHGAAQGVGLHDVQVQVLGHAAAHPHAAQRAAVGVQAGGEHADPHLSGQGAEHAPGHAGLRRDPHVHEPLPGVVVHPGGAHDGEDLAGHARRDDPLAGERVETARGEARAHEGEVAGGHEDGALRDVPGDHVLGTVLDDAVAAHHVAEGEVAVRGGQLGLVGLLVHPQWPAGERGEQGDEPVDPLLRARVRPHEELVHGDGAGVDHGVVRAVGLRLEGELVERLPGGVQGHAGVHLGAAAVHEGGRVPERLGDGLDGELRLVVAGGVEVPRDGGEGDAQPVRVRGGQRGDVLRELALVGVPEGVVEGAQVVLDRVTHQRASHHMPVRSSVPNARTGPISANPRRA